MSVTDLLAITRQNTLGTASAEADDKIKELSEELAEQKNKISSLENQLKCLVRYQKDQKKGEVSTGVLQFVVCCRVVILL